MTRARTYEGSLGVPDIGLVETAIQAEIGIVPPSNIDAEEALRLAVETPSVLRMRATAGSTRAYIEALTRQEQAQLDGAAPLSPGALALREAALRVFEQVAV
jgi:hypothetical protein